MAALAVLVMNYNWFAPEVHTHFDIPELSAERSTEHPLLPIPDCLPNLNTVPVAVDPPQYQGM